MDIMQRQGKYPLPPGASPIIGVEFSGTIEEAGESDYKVGDEVYVSLFFSLLSLDFLTQSFLWRCEITGSVWLLEELMLNTLRLQHQ